MTATTERPEAPPGPATPPDTPPDTPPPATSFAPTRVTVWRERVGTAARTPSGPNQAVGIAAAVTLAVLAAWALLYVYVISGLQHDRAQHRMYATFRSQVAQATAPIGGTIAPGTSVAALSIPAAGLSNEVVAEGTTSGVLRTGPGHLRTSPLPGQPGVSVVYGRSLAFGGPFAAVPGLRSGDRISVVTDQGRFRYDVTGVRRAGDPLTVPTTSTSRLTLVTSDGGWTPDQVVYVDAVLVGKPAPDPGGRPTALADSEKIMTGEHDPLTLTQLVLWLQLLLAVAALLVWLHRRWGRWQLWVVGVPGVLAAVWGLSNTAVRLLPNLI